MAKVRKGRRYLRGRRWWADFRDYTDVGGRLEPLVPKGQNLATTDPDEADELVVECRKELDQIRLLRRSAGVDRVVTLAEFADHHLAEKARTGEVTKQWSVESEKRLDTAVEYFGADRVLETIRPRDVKGWMAWLRENRMGKGGRPLSDGRVRHYINSLSNLYAKANEEECVRPGYNPVAALTNKPRSKRIEPKWFEVDKAALILEAARVYEPKRKGGIPFLYPLVATFLLTGGRRSEVLGLEVGDIYTKRDVLAFRPNKWRGFKTERSERVVPLHPQLKDILDTYVAEHPPANLLFPRFVAGKEQMATDIEKQFDGIAGLLGWEPASIRAQMFRNTYCAARLQTLDNDRPVSIYTVSRELGHTSIKLVMEVYGHLGSIRHRGAHVEYRIEQHADELKDELTALRTRT